jgi:hypothetical protein
MTDQATVYRAAKVLIDQHGQDAPIFAAMRADEHLANGEMDDYRLWGRICAAEACRRPVVDIQWTREAFGCLESGISPYHVSSIACIRGYEQRGQHA